MGYVHIPKTHAGSIDAFYRAHMDEYLNFHRVCAFATDTTDAKGKIRKKYDTFQTPYERLQSLSQWECFLRPKVTRVQLDAIAARESDLVSAQKMQKAKDKLFESFRKC
jgi:multidrug resistance efflux pump